MSLFRRNYTKRGASPGELVGSERQVAPKIHVIAFDEAVCEETTCTTVAEVRALVGTRAVAWIDVQGLGDGQLVQAIGDSFGVDPLAISDVVNVGQRPKIDDYAGGLFIVLRMVTTTESGRLQWEQVSLFLGEGFVLSFQETHEDCLEVVRNRLRVGRTKIRTSGADYLACTIIDAIVDGYFPVLEHYGELLERYESQIFGQSKKSVFGELYLTKRDLSSFRRAALPLREALSILIRNDDDWISEYSALHLRDTLDHTMQVVDVNESYRELAVSLVDVHLSMVGQRTNEIMRVLTVVSAIFIPLTFLAGIYGMNFDTSKSLNMPELRMPLGYPLFWVVCLVLAGSMLLVFQRLGWLKR